MEEMIVKEMKTRKFKIESEKWSIYNNNKNFNDYMKN